jgi:hypothetical protein
MAVIECESLGGAASGQPAVAGVQACNSQTEFSQATHIAGCEKIPNQ